MAKNSKVQADEDDVEETFTDLRGNTDSSPADDADVLADLADGKSRRKSKIQADPKEDEDDSDPLLMDEGDEEGEADPEDEEEDEEEADEGEGAEVEEPEVLGEDPRDRAIRQSRLDFLEERSQRLADQERSAKGAKDGAVKTMEAATKALKAAKEAGNTDAEIEAQQAYLDARDTITRADSALGLIEQNRDVVRGELAKIGFDFKTAQLADITPRVTQTAKLSPTAKKFLDANTKWIKDPKFKAKADVMFALDREMGGEAKWRDKKTSPEYFAELGRRFNRVSPGIIRGLDGKLIASGVRQRGVGASNGAMGSAGVSRQDPNRGGKVKFEETDKREMKKFGLDPGKKTHRVAWMREKTSMNASGGRA